MPRSLVAFLSLALLAACTDADLAALGGAGGSGGARGPAAGGLGGAARGGPAPAIAPTWQAPKIGEEPKDTTWRLAKTFDLGGAHEDGHVEMVRYAPDGRTIYVATDEGWLTAWDLDGAKATWEVHPGQSLDFFAVSPAGDRLAAFHHGNHETTTDYHVYVLDAKTGREVAKLFTTSFTPTCADYEMEPYRAIFGPDGALYVLYNNRLLGNQDACKPMQDRTIVRWDVATGKPLWHHIVKIPACSEAPPEFCGLPLPAMALSPNGAWLAGGFCDGSVFMLDTAGGREASRLKCGLDAPAGTYPADDPLDEGLNAFAWSPEGDRLYAVYGHATFGNKVVAFEGAGAGRLAYGKVLGNLGDAGSALEVSPDGGTVMMGLGSRFSLYDVATGKLRYRPRAELRALAASPVRRELVTLEFPRKVHLHLDGVEPAEDAAVAALRQRARPW